MEILKNFSQLKLAVEYVYSKEKSCFPQFVSNKEPKILIVSKNQKFEDIKLLINNGHKLFGENKVQEATEKWLDKLGCKLHFIGKLQTNKIKEALKLFDVIETIDRELLVNKICEEQHKLGVEREFYIQVNVGDEPQKSGVPVQQAQDFIEFCLYEKKLNVTGLMCLPPKNEAAFPYFSRLSFLAKENNLPHISMGMSADFVEAIECGSTQIRVGSAIFNN